jgi:AcrR family transcriptional regulator
MQDILAESGLSAGAVYSYFKSKDQIVEAVAAETLTDLWGGIEALIGNELPALDVLIGQIAALIMDLDQRRAVVRLAVQVWGEAVRAPQLAHTFRAAQQQLGEGITGLVERYAAQGLLPADTPAAETARVLIALMMGFVVQQALLDDADLAAFQAGVRGLLATARSAALSTPHDP